MSQSLFCSTSAWLSKITLIIANLITSFSCLLWRSHSLSPCPAQAQADWPSAQQVGVTPGGVTGLHFPRPRETAEAGPGLLSTAYGFTVGEKLQRQARTSFRGRPRLALPCMAEPSCTYNVVCSAAQRRKNPPLEQKMFPECKVLYLVLLWVPHTRVRP